MLWKQPEKKSNKNENHLDISPVGFNIKKFVFKCQNYLQIRTTPWAYYMCVLEVRYIYPFIETMSKFYLRLIDDIFEIWTGNTEQLMKFKQEIDKIHPSIKLNLILLIKK